MSALTPNLYRQMYASKVGQLFDNILHASNVGKPLMGRYLESYFDLFWDLHLGVKGGSIPASVREFGHSFITVLAYQDPTHKIFHDNYLTVRSHLASVTRWIGDRIGDLILLMEGPQIPKKTFINSTALRMAPRQAHGPGKTYIAEISHGLIEFMAIGTAITKTAGVSVVTLNLTVQAIVPDKDTWIDRDFGSVIFRSRSR